jgi:hypothetical protein
MRALQRAEQRRNLRRHERDTGEPALGVRGERRGNDLRLDVQRLEPDRVCLPGLADELSRGVLHRRLADARGEL